jgi:hypothetical protein
MHVVGQLNLVFSLENEHGHIIERVSVLITLFRKSLGHLVLVLEGTSWQSCLYKHPHGPSRDALRVTQIIDLGGVPPLRNHIGLHRLRSD